VGAGGAVAEMERLAMRVRVIVVRVVSVSRDGAIDMGAIGSAMRLIMVGLVPMRMAVNRAIGVDMFMRIFVLVFVLAFVMVRCAIDPCFAGAATASRTHFRTLQIRQS
jgi:hypothetical protein